MQDLLAILPRQDFRQLAPDSSAPARTMSTKNTS
jgi:hypothetical protein